MFGTVIIDAYRKEEALEMADAIDDLCSPTDNYGWASAGIYCFWDYYAEAVLYIGLAGDLAERFKQHNGILPIKEGSKQKQIEDYFSRNERLGYTIFVQSPLSQPLVHRNRKVYEKFAKQQNQRCSVRRQSASTPKNNVSKMLVSGPASATQNSCR